MSKYDSQDQAYCDLNEYALSLERERESLLEAIQNIADIIHYQMEPKHQDHWLASMIEAGRVTYEEE
jgi:hypothetical protein